MTFKLSKLIGEVSGGWLLAAPLLLDQSGFCTRRQFADGPLEFLLKCASILIQRFCLRFRVKSTKEKIVYHGLMVLLCGVIGSASCLEARAMPNENVRVDHGARFQNIKVIGVVKRGSIFRKLVESNQKHQHFASEVTQPSKPLVKYSDPKSDQQSEQDKRSFRHGVCLLVGLILGHFLARIWLMLFDDPLDYHKLAALISNEKLRHRAVSRSLERKETNEKQWPS